MARAASCLLALGLALSATARDEETATPVQKVVQLLTGMVEKGKTEKHEEAVQFTTYKKFCKDTTKQKQWEVKNSNELISSLEADIQKFESDASRLAKGIKKHDEDISTWEGNLKAAATVRETDAANFQQAYDDYGESIKSVEEGLDQLKKSDAKPQAALAQLGNSDIIPPETKSIIDAFLATDPDENVAVSAPETAAYQSQSEGIVDMLQGLLTKFEDERNDLEKQEMNGKFNYQLLAMDLKAQIDKATKSRTTKSEERGEAMQKVAAAKGDLADTTATRDDDSKYLSDLVATCEQKASDFDLRQKLRAEEIAAVEKAIAILGSGAVAGKEMHLLQQKSKRTLLQLRSTSQNPNQLRVAAYLKNQSQKIRSRMLAALALHVSDDPFSKVKKMLQDLVVKLMEEANEEAEHNGWCNTEMSTNEQTRKEKTDGVESLTAAVDQLTASISVLGEEIAQVTAQVAELDAAMAKATAIREEEKNKNSATVKDAKDAQVAIAQALSVLKDFYAKAGQATAFVQKKKQEPEIFDAPYKGMAGENGGVVGMIEVIQSDFSRVESDTMAAEEQASKEYDEFMGDSSKDRAQKDADLSHKAAMKQDQEGILAEKKNDLEATQKELDAAMVYYEKLKPSCIDAGVNYEDRVARRKEEIESLNEALKILSGE